MIEVSKPYKSFGNCAGAENTENKDNSDDVSNQPQKDFFSNEYVNKGYKKTIRERFDTILNDHKKKWSDVYNKIGLYKSHASMIRNGHIIPPMWLRLKICEEMKCDTSQIWDVPILISADKIKESENANS